MQKYPDQKMIDEGLLTLDINEISHLGHDEILESLKKFDKNKKLNNVDSKASLFLNIIKAQPAPPFFTKKQPEPQQLKESKKRMFGLF